LPEGDACTLLVAELRARRRRFRQLMALVEQQAAQMDVAVRQQRFPVTPSA
jgi:hypothetical protein